MNNILKDYHLITSENLDEYVITKTENAIAVLDSTITEMERRFQVFSDVRVRNLDEYNKKKSLFYILTCKAKILTLSQQIQIHRLHR